MEPMKPGEAAFGLFFVFFFAALGALLVCVGGIACRFLFHERALWAVTEASILTAGCLMVPALICRLIAWIRMP